MKIIVENAVWLNGGDAAIQYALLSCLEKVFGEDIQVVFSDQQARVAKRLFPEQNFIRPHTLEIHRSFTYRALNRLTRNRFKSEILASMSRLHHFLSRAPGWVPVGPLHTGLREYRNADLIVATGGTYISTHYGVERLVVELDKPAAKGIPLIFFTQTIDSIDQSASFARLGKLISTSRAALVRDNQSKLLATELAGPTTNVHVLPDSVFLLADQQRILDRAAKAHKLPNKGFRIAISVRDWSHFKTKPRPQGMSDYEKAVAAATDHLVSRYGAEVTYLSTCQGVPEYPYNDAVTAKRIFDRLASETQRSVTIDQRFRKPVELLQTLSTFDYAISTRMHMAILSMCAGVPVLPIAYERKTTSLFESLGLGAWLAEIETVSSEQLIVLLDDWLEHREYIATTLAEQTLHLRRQAEDAARIISTAMKDCRPKATDIAA